MAAVPEIGRAVGIHGSPAPAVEHARDLFERYSDQIQRFCHQQLGSREEAEDAVQSTFLNAFRGLNRGIQPDSESAWLYKIAHNVCLARRRARFRRGRVETPGDLQALAEVIVAPQPRDGHRLVALEEALRSMPQSQRQAILLREWRGLSYREIAAELELSQAAVETLLFRARRSLAEALERPEKRSRIRSIFDGGSLVGVLKGLFGGGVAVKTAAVVAVAVTATSAGVVAGVARDGGTARQIEDVPAPMSGAGSNVSSDGARPARVSQTPRSANGGTTAPRRGSAPAGPGAAAATGSVAPIVGGPAPTAGVQTTSGVAAAPAGSSGATDDADTSLGGGSSGLAPGQTGAAPGKSGQTPANGALPPGQSGAAPGKSGQTPGQIKQEERDPPPGQGGTAPGQSSTAPGQIGEAPGQIKNEDGDAPGPPDTTPAAEQAPPKPDPGPPPEPPGQEKKGEK